MDSEHKTFNRQANANYIGGSYNVISNNQTRFHIRAYSNTVNPVGQNCEPGHLRDFDLRVFRLKGIPHYVEIAVLNKTTNNEIWLDCIFHYYYKRYSKHVRVVDGWILSDNHGQIIKTFVTGPTHKSRSIIKEVATVIAEAHQTTVPQDVLNQLKAQTTFKIDRRYGTLDGKRCLLKCWLQRKRNSFGKGITWWICFEDGYSFNTAMAVRGNSGFRRKHMAIEFKD